MKHLLLLLSVIIFTSLNSCEKHSFMDRVTGTITEKNNVPCGKSLFIVLDDSTLIAHYEVCKCIVTWQDGQRVRLSYQLCNDDRIFCNAGIAADIVFIEDIE